MTSGPQDFDLFELEITEQKLENSYYHHYTAAPAGVEVGQTHKNAVKRIIWYFCAEMIITRLPLLGST